MIESIKELGERIQTYMKPERYQHTVGTKDTAILLAGKYGCEKHKSATAALLHDIARDMPLGKMKRLIVEEGYMVQDEFVRDNPGLLHAHIGVLLARKDFGIVDNEILNAIRYHTTGRRSMGLLEKIIFVADYIEPGRTFRGVKTARKIAMHDLDSAVFHIYRNLLRYLISEKHYICEDTLFGYNELALKYGITQDIFEQ